MTTPRIITSNKFISVETAPELAGKITSLRDAATGHEWLWTNPHLKLRQPVYGESYVEKIDFGGWDEIFPTVSPVTLADGTEIPDHGDLVFLPAEVLEQSDTALTLRWTTRCYACSFTRRIELEGDSMKVDYVLESHSDKSLPYLWASHPLVALEDGMILELPSDDLDVLDTGGKLKDLIPPQSSGDSHRFTIHDPALGECAAGAAKIFSQPGEVTWFALHRKQGGTLRMQWDGEDCPYFGFWLNQRGWSGCGSEPYFNIGLEPTTAPFDDLNDAIQAGLHRVLEPGAVRKWSVRVQVS